MKNRFFSIFTTIGCFAFILLFLSNPKYYSSSALEGLNLFCVNVLPCLFPFFVACKLLIGLNCLNAIEKIFSPITRIYTKEPKGAFVFLISLISGFPVGVATACELQQKNIISKQSCENICILCNFAGPIFVIGTVGSFFENQKIAIILYISSLLGALINALFFCKKTNENIYFRRPYPEVKESKTLFTDCMYSSINNILFVGATIMIFYVLGKMIFASLPILSPLSQTLIQGILEVTSSTKLASQLPNKFLGVVISSGSIGFGGLCVFLQTCAFWQKSGINCFSMLIKKATQGVASMFFCAILCIIFKI